MLSLAVKQEEASLCSRHTLDILGWSYRWQPVIFPFVVIIAFDWLLNFPSKQILWHIEQFYSKLVFIRTIPMPRKIKIPADNFASVEGIEEDVRRVSWSIVPEFRKGGRRKEKLQTKRGCLKFTYDQMRDWLRLVNSCISILQQRMGVSGKSWAGNPWNKKKRRNMQFKSTEGH